MDLEWPPAPPVDVTAIERGPRKHRHDFHRQSDGTWQCFAHAEPVVRDEAKARMGRLNRTRGNRIQRQRITALGGRNLAGNNPNLDGLGLMFRYESKSGGAFPERLWRWLSDIPVQAGQTPVLIVTETPGPGRKARSVVVVSFEDWQALHQEERT